jgi:hypothetical protein
MLHLTPKEEMETTLIRSLIASYFGITRQTIQDLVPKAIMHLLVSLPCTLYLRWTSHQGGYGTGIIGPS